jgi:pimeloyl-ACP methyl ester carboxylesterase
VKAEIRYVRSGGVAIAYQVVGEGEPDLVFVPDYCSNLVYGWESRYWRPFYERVAESFRLILFDKRGTGPSSAAATTSKASGNGNCTPSSDKSARP